MPPGRNPLEILEHELAELKAPNSTPRRVLLELMLDAYQKYKEAKERVATGKATKEEKTELDKLYTRAMKAAIAVAPHYHPKLVEMDVSGELGVSFVFRVPPQELDSDRWLANYSDTAYPAPATKSNGS
jgi:hypothetical protein